MTDIDGFAYEGYYFYVDQDMYTEDTSIEWKVLKSIDCCCRKNNYSWELSSWGDEESAMKELNRLASIYVRIHGEDEGSGTDGVILY